MINRVEIKSKAKEILRTCRLNAAIVSVILSLAICTFSAGGSGDSTDELSFELAKMPTETLAILAGAIGIGLIAGLAIRFLLLKPLEVGCQKFFLLSDTDRQMPVSTVISTFKDNYMNQVITMFCRDLFIFLWTMLFIIPGIVKIYSYRMVPYILAEDPSTDRKTALTRSRAMMNGHKWEAFVFDLSFIGWHLLSIITCGIAGLVYVNPYMYLADAGLYRTLKTPGNVPAEPENKAAMAGAEE